MFEDIGETISLLKTIKFVVDNRGKTAPTSSNGIALIATNCVSNDDLYPTYKSVRYVSVETHATWFRAHPRPGDILLTLKGSQNGAVCLVPDPVDFTIAQDMVALRVDSTVVDPLFLFAALRSPNVQNQIRNLDVSGIIPHFKKSDFDKLLLPYPDRSTQEHIGKLYFLLCSKIDLNRRMNEGLEAIARAFFKDWFVDFGPTRAKMEAREAYLPPEIWSLFPDRLNKEGNPEGWDGEPLVGFFSIIGGGTPKTTIDDYWAGTIPWFSVEDTPATGSIFVVATSKTITQKGLDESSARLVPKGTTIISARGTVGNLAMAGQPMAFNQSCYGLRGEGAVGDCFVFLAAQNMVGRLQSIAHGSVFSTITRQTFEAVTMAKPGDHVLAVFEEAVRPLFAMINANVVESQTLARTRDLLLPKLMSGEIRVKDAEKNAEAVL